MLAPLIDLVPRPLWQVVGAAIIFWPFTLAGISILVSKWDRSKEQR